MQPSRELPPHYELHGTLDISKSRLMAVSMNIAAAGAFFLFGWMALQFLRMTRSDAGSIVIGLSGMLGVIDAVAVIVAVVVLVILQIIVVVLHEAAHGVFFWYFTRERPVFGLKLPYAAYAAAPDWYLPRSQHLVVGLAPFVLITLAGLALLLAVPARVVPWLLFVVVSNATGAVGDFLMVAWLLMQPRESLVCDTGSAIMIYRPVAQL